MSATRVVATDPSRGRKRSALPGNPVNDGLVFGIGAVSDDFALESFGDAAARSILHRDRVDETLLAQVFVRPGGERSHHFPTKTVTVRAFLHPEAQFGRWPVEAFERGHAKAFMVVAPPDDEGEDIRVRGPQPFFAACEVFAPCGRVPAHEPGDGGRDAGKNFFCIR